MFHKHHNQDSDNGESHNCDSDTPIGINSKTILLYRNPAGTLAAQGNDKIHIQNKKSVV